MNHPILDSDNDMYIAPELRESQLDPHTNAVDVYSFGILVYALMCAKYQKRPIGPDDLENGVLNTDEGWATALVDLGIPEDVVDLIYACCTRDPTARPEFKEIVDYLLKCRYLSESDVEEFQEYKNELDAKFNPDLA